MLAFLVLLLAVLSRFLPHMMSGTGLNFTMVGAGLLFFGSRRPKWQFVFAIAAMALTDVILTKFVYGYAFHVSGYLMTWAWYGAVCLIGSGLLRKVTALRVVAGVLASATSFFLLSNFVVWMGSGMYAHSLAGMTTCFASALPFYGNDMLSTAACSAVLFGVPVLAARMAESMGAAEGRNQTLA